MRSTIMVVRLLPPLQLARQFGVLEETPFSLEYLTNVRAQLNN